MDNLIQLAVQIIFCLLIAAILGAIIGYLLGKMSKCDENNNDFDINSDKKELNDYSSNQTEAISAMGLASMDATETKKYKDILEPQFDLKNHTSIGQEIGIRPKAVREPFNGDVDDLKEISGIGIKIEETLNSLGIYYYHQIAQWSPENIEWVENYLSVKRRVKKEDWIGQSKILSASSKHKN